MKNEVGHWSARTLAETEGAPPGGLDPDVTQGVALRWLVAPDNNANHYAVVVRREQSGKAEYHEHESDVMIGVGGTAKVIAGGEIPSMLQMEGQRGQWMGESVQGGISYTLGVGDLMVIPPCTPHQLIVEPGEAITYLTIKVKSP